MNDEKERIPSQIDRILAVLESGGTLTALDALEDFGCSRLASRITDLKRKGYPVAFPHGTAPQPLRQTVPRR